MLEGNRLNREFNNGGAQNAKWLHRFAFLTAVATFCLIFVGGLVKSHEAGLSVPDWPTTYGEFMLTFPYSKWVGNIFYEHSHRVLATFVGLFITVQAIALQFQERRVWVKILGWYALFGVIAQGILGGLTVIYFLPPAISSAHAGLAQIVFCLTLTITVVTSKHWKDNLVKLPERLEGVSLRKISSITVGAIFLQLMMGAVMRHLNAGLAIPTFPLANGNLIPEFTSAGVAINFAHRVGALLVSGLVITTAVTILRWYKRDRTLVRPAILSLVVLVVQVTLGAITILSEKAVTPTTLHVSGGAALLGTMLLIALRAHHLYAPATAREAHTATSRPTYSKA
jgi:cytochrome c oxidase assembly protein subunit 15